MLGDRDVIEENIELLVRQWRHLTRCSSLNDFARLGMSPETADELRALDEIQVQRAADCATPLFRFCHPDDVLIRAMRSKESWNFSSRLRDEVDIIIDESNLLLLMNRWSAARMSPAYAQCVLGMSSKLIDALCEATATDLQQAASGGIRLAKLTPCPKYLFHAGRNIRLKRFNRTFLAVCAASDAS